MASTPKKKRVRKKTVTTTTQAPYTVTLQIGKDTYVRSGDNLTEIINGFQIPKINYRGVFTLQHEGKQSSLMRNVFQIRRIVSSKLPAFFLGKNLLLLLK